MIEGDGEAHGNGFLSRFVTFRFVLSCKIKLFHSYAENFWNKVRMLMLVVVV